MTVGVNAANYKVLGQTESEVGSRVELVTSLSAPPERVWETLRSFNSQSTKGLLKVLYQETHRTLIYEISGLPKTVKTMVGEIRLQPDGTGTRLHWSVRFSTKPTMFARLLRPLMRAGIARTLHESVRNLQQEIDQ